jgi:hypothetical protein
MKHLSALVIIQTYIKKINHEIKYSFKHSFIQYEDEVGDEDDDELL